MKQERKVPTWNSSQQATLTIKKKKAGVENRKTSVAGLTVWHEKKG
jgi:hypothetical protein